MTLKPTPKKLTLLLAGANLAFSYFFTLLGLSIMAICTLFAAGVCLWGAWPDAE